MPRYLLGLSLAVALALAGCPVSDDDDSGGDDDAGDDDAGDGPLTDLPTCELPVMTYFTEASIHPPGAGSDDFEALHPGQPDWLRTAIEAMVAGDEEQAEGAAGNGGYLLCEGADADRGIVLFHPNEIGYGRAIVAWRIEDARPLIVGTPHPFFELLTLPQGVQIFEALPARVLIAAGTHRCANSTYTPCDGSTSVCSGSSEPYRTSDQAHVVDTSFQVAHEAFADRFPDDWVINLHGMSGDGISLSDGTTLDRDAGAPVALLGTALMAAYPSKEITSCNAWPGAVVEERLCGTTNTQGRYVNGSPDPCGTAATQSADRFLHMEQELSIRQQPQPVLDALDAVVPAVR